MHAYIVTGSSADKRSEQIKKMLVDRAIRPYDTITIAPEGASIGVSSVRGVLGRLSIHPVTSACHAVIVNDAHSMTTEAQNAFLKTLEEPPGEALIILETDQPDSLLPTVLSRAITIRLNASIQTNDALIPCLATVEQLTKSSIGKRLQIIDSIAKTRDDALLFVDQAIVVLHKELAGHYSHAKLLRALLAARTHIMGNITPKLALDAAFLST